MRWIKQRPHLLAAMMDIGRYIVRCRLHYDDYDRFESQKIAPSHTIALKYTVNWIRRGGDDDYDDYDDEGEKQSRAGLDSRPALAVNKHTDSRLVGRVGSAELTPDCAELALRKPSAAESTRLCES